MLESQDVGITTFEGYMLVTIVVLVLYVKHSGHMTRITLITHAGCTKNGTPKLAQSHKPPESQLFEISLKPLESFKNGKIISWLRIDTHDHVPEVLSRYNFF